MRRLLANMKVLAARKQCMALLAGLFAGTLWLGFLPSAVWAGQRSEPGEKAWRTLSGDEIVRLFSELDSTRKSTAFSGIVEVRHLTREKRRFPLRVWFKPPNLFHMVPLRPLPHMRPEPRMPVGLHRWTHGMRGPRGTEVYKIMPMRRYLELFSRNYQVRMAHDGQIAGLPADLLDIRPNFPPRFGIRLWLDRDSHFILGRQILFYRPERPPRPILEIAFTEINFHPVFPDSVLAIVERRAKRMEKMKKLMARRHHNIRRFGSLDSLKAALDEPIFVPDYLPRGFDLVSRSVSIDKKRKTVHLHYTDGLLNLSIFEIHGEPPRSLERYRPPRHRRRPEPFHFQEMLVRRLGEDRVFLLIGNLPRRELRRIANSLREY